MKREDFARKLCASGSSFKDIICDHIAFEAFPEVHQTAEGKQCLRNVYCDGLDSKRTPTKDIEDWLVWKHLEKLNHFLWIKSILRTYCPCTKLSPSIFMILAVMDPIKPLRSDMRGEALPIETLEVFRLNIPEITGAWNFLLVLILYDVWFCTANMGSLPLLSHSKMFQQHGRCWKQWTHCFKREKHTNSRPSLIISMACLCQWCRLSSHARSFLTAPWNLDSIKAPTTRKQFSLSWFHNQDANHCAL